MNKTNTYNSEFNIYESKKIAIVVIIFAVFLLVFGGIFLYSHFISSGNFIKWFGVISMLLGLIFISLTLNSLSKSKPIISVSKAGIDFNISFFKKYVFIPWDGIMQITIERIGTIGFWKTECLVFYISKAHSKKIPLLIKNTYLKIDNRIYFASLKLSIPVEDAVEKLQSYIK